MARPSTSDSNLAQQQNTSRSYIQFGRYGIDNQCPICLSSEARLPVETNCGHLFCGACIVKYWKHGDFVTAMPCPFCRQPVSVLLPCFRQDLARQDQPNTSPEPSSTFSLLNGIRSRASLLKPFVDLNGESGEEPTLQQLVHEINDYNRRFSGSRPVSFPKLLGLKNFLN